MEKACGSAEKRSAYPGWDGLSADERAPPRQVGEVDPNFRAR